MIIDIATSPVYDLGTNTPGELNCLAVVLRADLYDGKVTRYIVHNRLIHPGGAGYDNGQYFHCPMGGQSAFERAHACWAGRCQRAAESYPPAPLWAMVDLALHAED